MQRLTIILGSLVLAAVVAACGGASAAVPSGAPAGDTVTVVAKDLTFSQPAVSVKAGETLDIAFDNQDGAPHNIAISDASGKNVFKGDIVSGTTVTYHVPALAAGTYAFLCEVHPDMKGTITAR